MSYHPDDAVIHHALCAYLAKKFRKIDLYKKHLEYAVDHSSNQSPRLYGMKEIMYMINNGREFFHDQGEDEITKAPARFHAIPQDIEIDK